MPDLRGLSAREALRRLTQIGLTAKLDGTGFVTDQSPQPGTLIGDASGGILKLGRHPVTHAGGTRP
jgi:hypothetical protein